MESKEELMKMTKEELVEKLTQVSAQAEGNRRNVEILSKRLERALKLAGTISDLYISEQ